MGPSVLSELVALNSSRAISPATAKDLCSRACREAGGASSAVPNEVGHEDQEVLSIVKDPRALWDGFVLSAVADTGISRWLKSMSRSRAGFVEACKGKGTSERRLGISRMQSSVRSPDIVVRMFVDRKGASFRLQALHPTSPNPIQASSNSSSVRSQAPASMDLAKSPSTCC